MGDLLLCAVCRQTQQDPVLLPCCAASICAVHVDSECPLCDGRLESSGLKRNYLLLAMGSARSLCQRCEETDAQVLCANCSAGLCKECSAVVHAQGVYRRHSFLPVTVGSIRQGCELHPSQPLTYFCTSEWTTLCAECAKGHAGHPVLRIESLMEDTLREISAKEENVKEMMKKASEHCSRLAGRSTELSVSAEKAKLQVKSLVQSLKDALSAKEEELLKAINTHFTAKSKEISLNLKESLSTKQRLDAILDLLAFAKTQSAGILVDSLKYLSSILEKVPEINENVPNFSFPTSVNGNKAAACIDSLALEEGESGSKSLRLAPSRGSVPDLSSEPRHQSKGSKSPIGRSSMTIREAPLSPTRAKAAMTPRTLPRTAASKSFEDSSKPATLSSALDDQPLAQRVFVKKAQSTSAIQVSWNHPANALFPVQYVLEYGVGTKVGSIEQFRQVYKGSARTCIITDLLPKTSYRFRVAPMALAPEALGDWSEVASITTFDQQCVDPQTCGQHAFWTVRGSDRFLSFEKAGIVAALNPILFGRTSWEVRITSSGLFSQEDSPSALKIGVIVGKTKLVTGSTVIYSGKPASKVKVCIDAENRSMTCYTPTHPQGETFQHLSEGPLLPAFLNKPGKMGGGSVKMWVNFEVPYEEGF